MSETHAIVEKWLGDKRVRLLVKDKNEYLQRYWARGDIYEFDLYGSAPMRRAAGWLFDKVSQRTRRVRRMGMLSYIQDNYRGGTFVDVGSCIGNHTLFFAVACQAKQVLSFEPVPELNSHQRELLDLNGLGNVKLFQCALGERTSKLHLTKSNFAKNAGMSKFDTSPKPGTIEVDVRTLDEVCGAEGITDVKLVKIDVEGFNVPFLRGAAKTLEKLRPDVFVECDSARALADVESYLRGLAYTRHEDLVFNLTPTYLFQPKRA